MLHWSDQNRSKIYDGLRLFDKNIMLKCQLFCDLQYKRVPQNCFNQYLECAKKFKKAINTLNSELSKRQSKWSY